MESLNLYAMVDKSGHVCRDEDGKVVYDREDHHALDVRLFNMHRPESKPHTVVRFVTHADHKALEDKLQNCKRDYVACSSEMIATEREVERLTAELAECRKDAERWLAFRNAGLPITFLGTTYEDMAQLDKSIDKTIERTKA